jgi:hypothetical protein
VAEMIYECVRFKISNLKNDFGNCSSAKFNLECIGKGRVECLYGSSQIFNSFLGTRRIEMFLLVSDINKEDQSQIFGNSSNPRLIVC